MQFPQNAIVKDIEHLNEKSVAVMIKLFRELKQTDYEVIVFRIKNCRIDYDNKSIKGRYNWTRSGQIVRNLLSEAPQTTV